MNYAELEVCFKAAYESLAGEAYRAPGVQGANSLARGPFVHRLSQVFRGSLVKMLSISWRQQDQELALCSGRARGSGRQRRMPAAGSSERNAMEDTAAEGPDTRSKRPRGRPTAVEAVTITMSNVASQQSRETRGRAATARNRQVERTRRIVDEHAVDNVAAQAMTGRGARGLNGNLRRGPG